MYNINFTIIHKKVNMKGIIGIFFNFFLRKIKTFLIYINNANIKVLKDQAKTQKTNQIF